MEILQGYPTEIQEKDINEIQILMDKFNLKQKEENLSLRIKLFKFGLVGVIN